MDDEVPIQSDDIVPGAKSATYSKKTKNAYLFYWILNFTFMFHIDRVGEIHFLQKCISE